LFKQDSRSAWEAASKQEHAYVLRAPCNVNVRNFDINEGDTKS